MNTNSLKTASHRDFVKLNGFRSGIAMVFFSYIFTAITSAADYYVATTGSDSYTATQAKNSATPWETIQKAADNVSAGDTVHVAPGTYTLTSAGISLDTSGNSSNRITFVSDTKWGAKLQDKPSDPNKVMWWINGNYVDIKNFELTGGSYGIYVSGSNVKIISNKIHDLTGTAAASEITGYNNQNVDFIGNIIYNIGSSFLDHGIYASSNGGIVSNNITFNVAGYGIHAWHAARNYTISNNLVYNCAEGGIVVGNGDAPGGTTAKGFIVTNNIIIYNGYFGIEEWGQTGTNNVYKNNLVYENDIDDEIKIQYGEYPQNTLNVDPEFVNFKLDGTGDYHLSATSPAIHTGTTQGAPSDDFDGLIRRGNPSIGPLEIKSTVTSGSFPQK